MKKSKKWFMLSCIAGGMAAISFIVGRIIWSNRPSRSVSALHSAYNSVRGSALPGMNTYEQFQSVSTILSIVAGVLLLIAVAFLVIGIIKKKAQQIQKE